MTIGSRISSTAPGDLTIATDLGVPRSTAQGWLGAARRAVVSLDVAHLAELELRQEILKLRRRVEKLAALLRLALALLYTSGFRLSGQRLPDGHAKQRILRVVDRAHEYIPLRAALRFLRMSPCRFHAWRRRQTACALGDQLSCPRTSPHRLTSSEVQAPSAGLRGAEVLELDDRSLVASSEIPVAPPSRARERRDHPPAGRSTFTNTITCSSFSKT